MNTLAENLHCDGCCLISGALSAEQIEVTCQQLEHLLQSNQTGILKSNDVAYGVRNLLQLWPKLVDLVRIPNVIKFVQQQFESDFGVVRALLFDKPPEKSWSLPWHRDRTIAIATSCNKNSLPAELSNWTMKAGVPHANASDRILSHMLTLRFSLDPMTSENGPLVYLPGSHRPLQQNMSTDNLTIPESFSDDEDLAKDLERRSIRQLECNAGDLFIMRPLLAHSSRTSSPRTSLRRRVIHIELAPADEGIPWFEFSKV